MARDFYAEAQDLAADLAELGHRTEADQIRTAVAAGSTATEMLMALRWTLGRLRSVEPNLPSAVQARANDLREAINRALT
jgi:hypothetical protein